jgi:hypothetical protein
MTLESGEVFTKSVRTARYVIEDIGVSSLMISTSAPRVDVNNHCDFEFPAGKILQGATCEEAMSAHIASFARPKALIKESSLHWAAG